MSPALQAGAARGLRSESATTWHVQEQALHPGSETRQGQRSHSLLKGGFQGLPTLRGRRTHTPRNWPLGGFPAHRGPDLTALLRDARGVSLGFGGSAIGKDLCDLLKSLPSGALFPPLSNVRSACSLGSPHLAPQRAAPQLLPRQAHSHGEACTVRGSGGPHLG